MRSADHSSVLVTGGAGFVGSHLCDQLLERGHQVFCLDNFYTGRRANIDHLLDHPRFHLIEQDVRSELPRLAFSQVWNLACPASPPSYQRDPVMTMMTSVIGARNCLDLARDVGARLFQASTSEVYGDPLVHPQPEGYTGAVNSIGPRACYDEGKRAAEALCFDYHRTFGVEIRLVRIFNTYGPRMDPQDGRVVSNFICAALTGQPIVLHGEGRQTRSFCYVDDLIRGFFALMEAPSPVTGPVNLGNPGEFTIRELAERVIALNPDPKSPLRNGSRPPDDPMQRRPDIGLAKRLLDWQPKVDLDAGLRRTIPYFAEQIGAERATEAAE